MTTNLTHFQESNESWTQTGLCAILRQWKKVKKRKLLGFPDRGLPTFSGGRLKIFHNKDLSRWGRLSPAHNMSISHIFYQFLVCWVFRFGCFGFFFKEELKPSSQSTRCRRQSILMVWLLNSLWIFTVDQQKVMKHRCSCNCDTLGKFILLNEPQLHTSTCVMWKSTGGTRGYNRGYIGMITGWFRTCEGLFLLICLGV